MDAEGASAVVVVVPVSKESSVVDCTELVVDDVEEVSAVALPIEPLAATVPKAAANVAVAATATRRRRRWMRRARSVMRAKLRLEAERDLRGGWDTVGPCSSTPCTTSR